MNSEKPEIPDGMSMKEAKKFAPEIKQNKEPLISKQDLIGLAYLIGVFIVICVLWMSMTLLSVLALKALGWF